MNIIIDRNKEFGLRFPVIEIDTAPCNYPREIRDAIKTALSLEGHDEDMIDEIFGKTPECMDASDNTMTTPQSE